MKKVIKNRDDRKINLCCKEDIKIKIFLRHLLLKCQGNRVESINGEISAGIEGVAVKLWWRLRRVRFQND